MSDALPLTTSSQPRAIQEARKRFPTRLQVERARRNSRLGRALGRIDCQLARPGDHARSPKADRLRIGTDGATLSKFKQTNERAARCLLADAQFFVAREHGFASWPKFARHLEGLARANSPVSTFEAAVDAIVNGDLTRLEKLLNENPKLARARSTRDHRSTLLHYVSANGVEDFRQKTPQEHCRDYEAAAECRRRCKC